MKEYKYLSPEFLAKYEGINPFQTEIGLFTYMRTYSRYLHDEGRRETWLETVARAVDYNIGLADETVKEAEELFDNIFNLRQFLSGRTLWVGGTEIAHQYPMSNYNCAFIIMDDAMSFRDLFYVLLIGSGGGFRARFDDVAKMPTFRNDIELHLCPYKSVHKVFRKEHTSVYNENDINGKQTMVIEIGDSKEGWTEAVEWYFKLMSEPMYRSISRIEIDFDNIRPKGEPLMRFGGFASGHEPMVKLFEMVHGVIKERDGKLRPIDVVDINNKIGEVIVVGGVRRTSEIAGIDHDDTESIQMKNNLYTRVGGKYELNEAIAHRQMSNNSIYYYTKPSREQLHWHIQQMRYTGEPAWVNAEYGQKRRPNFEGVNPCAEILLDSKGMCNLTELNAMAFVKGGFVDVPAMLKAQKLSARAGMRMTIPTMELKEWDKVSKRDRPIGCSITGWYDMVNATNMDVDVQRDLLTALKFAVDTEVRNYSAKLGVNIPVLTTTIKPSGTLSLLPTVSSGIHYSHSAYYMRRIRVSADDPLAKAMISKGRKWYPEVGQDPENPEVVVFEFPIKAPEGKTKADVSAVEQLENYLLFMENYVDHNVSITVHVRENEWQDVEEFVWEHWDEIMAVSFIPYSDSMYELMPYETITEDEYYNALDEIIPIDYTALLLEDNGQDFEIENSSCEKGICPVK